MPAIAKIINVNIRDALTAIERANYDTAYASVLAAYTAFIDDAKAGGPDRPQYRAIGTLMERLGPNRMAWDALRRFPDTRDRGLPDWQAENAADVTVAIEKRIRDIGADLRMGRTIELAARICAGCNAYVDPRLVELFQRSFPSANILPHPPSGEPLDGDVLAGYEALAWQLNLNAQAITDTFIPLLPDPVETTRLRHYYQSIAKGRKIVGLSWHSSNTNKDMPTLAEWTPLLSAENICFVSVNYGDRYDDIEQFSNLSGAKIVPDPIDQIENLDDLAAQIGALDHLVSISNTSAHMAGAMGQSLSLIDTAFRGATWPYGRDATPWYPRAKIFRKVTDWKTSLSYIAADSAVCR